MPLLTETDVLIIQLRAKAKIIEQQQHAMLRLQLRLEAEAEHLAACDKEQRCLADDLATARRYLGPTAEITVYR